MVETFTQKYADTIVDRLKETWMEDCKTEEMFSVSKFKGKENFFLNHTDSGLKWKSDDESRSNTTGRQRTSKSKYTKPDNGNEIASRNVEVSQEKSSRGPNLRITRKLNNKPDKVVNKHKKHPNKEQGRNNITNPRSDQRRTNQSDTSERFEVGALHKLRKTRSLTSIPSNITIVPETQEEDREDQINNDNFLFHGQGAKEQDHQ